MSRKGSGGNNIIHDATSFYWWYHDRTVRHDGGATAPRSPTSKIVCLDARWQSDDARLQRRSRRRRRARRLPVDSNAFFPVDGLGWNATRRHAAGRATATTSRSPASSATSSPTRAARCSTSPATTTCGCSSTASSPSTSAACQQAPQSTARSPSNAGARTATQPRPHACGGMYEIALFQAERHTTARTTSSR